MSRRGEGCIFLPKWTRNGRTYTGSNYMTQYRVNGKRMRESSRSPDLRVAKALLRKRLAEVEEGKPVEPGMHRVKVSDLAQDLENDYRANERRSLRRLRALLGNLLPFFGHRRAATVTSADANQYIVKRQEEGATNGTINRELTALRRMYTLAVRAGKIRHAPYIPRLQEDNTREGFFERGHYEAILENLPGYLRPAITFAYLTGWRVHSEILPLTWRQVDFDGGVVRLEPGTTKNKEGRTFPLIPELRVVLEAQRMHTERLQRQQGRIIPWVFHRDGEQIKGFRKAWARACKKAGCPGKIPHDFRRTAVRNMERAGVPRSVAMKLSGHKTESVYRRYAIVDETSLREGADRLSSFMVRDVVRAAPSVCVSMHGPVAQTDRAEVS